MKEHESNISFAVFALIRGRFLINTIANCQSTGQLIPGR